MKKSLWIRALALVLIVCMLTPTAAAAFGRNTGSNRGLFGFLQNLWSWVSDLFEKEEPVATEPVVTQPAVTEAPETEPAETMPPQTDPVETEPVETEPEETEPVETDPEETENVETEPVETEPEETEPEETEPVETQEEMVLDLIEDDTTVENGEMLRASTFALRPVSADAYAVDTAAEEGTEEAAESGTVLKYFPVTLYDYEQSIINNATHKVEYDANNNLTRWDGIYFSGGSPAAIPATFGAERVEVKFANGYAIIEAGDYLLVNARSNQALVGDTSGITGTTSWNDATIWTITATDEEGQYTIQASDNYLLIGSDIAGCKITDSENSVSLRDTAADSTAFQLFQNNNYLNWYTGAGTNYGGWTDDGDANQSFYLYKVVEDEIVTTDSLSFAEWNHWNKASGNNNNGQKTYTGLVESTLNAHKDIVFTKPDGGIFNSDASVKTIYTNVEMPFVYAQDVYEDGTKSESYYYTFDASINGVYFHPDNTQGSSGTAASNTRLYFNKNSVQNVSNVYWGDGSSTVWAPFNDTTSLSGDGNTNLTDMNYHFGMRATIPFTMTPNGRMKATDSDSEPIIFSFSGDDDVWVFIDGQLVGDLGGIHNRLDLKIDFATNLVTYSESNDSTTETGSYNDEDFELEQTLFTFTEEDGTVNNGLITQDRETFAASDSHELTIFYLERGQGSSNSRIKFNLPMKDSVTITKNATKSWSQEAEDEDLKVNPDDNNAGVDALTAAEQAAVDNVDFGFTLYKSVDGGTTFDKVVNTNYYLINASGQVLSMPSTDSNGHFYLRNGQSARFITELDASDGVTYYVVEDDVSKMGFVTPDYNFGGEAANGYTVTDIDGNSVTDNADAQTEEGIKFYSKGNLIPEQILDLPKDNEAQNNESYHVTVKGSNQSEDSLVFICENYLNAKLPNPSARPADDKIVIDYGLPVEIDVLANDLFRGDSIELISVTGQGLEMINPLDDDNIHISADGITNDNDGNDETLSSSELLFGTATIENGKILYSLTTQMSGVEVLNYVVKVTGSETNDATGDTKTAYQFAIGTVYIIPATTMYYEENFGSLITYEGAGWDTESEVETKYQNATQEPGVVGTNGDSPYGSDVAYLNDSKDSNGSFRHAKTTYGAVRFTYVFTGTGTSIFARTSNNSGNMRIQLFDENSINEDGTLISGSTPLCRYYRNTYYNNEKSAITGPLYNIPVFTTADLHYGTYLVEVVVAKENVNVGYHSEFWLDGIRVFEPLNESDENYDVAESAYATDAEANMANITLREKLISTVNYREETTTVVSVAKDENGNVIYKTVEKTDDDGNPILDADGNVVTEQVPLLVETEETISVPEWPEDGSFVVFTDTNGEIKTAEDYVSIGPKEEVYIYDGQVVTFSLQNWDPNSNKLYMGMKAPTGIGKVIIGGTSKDINNAVDCYYDVSSYATITTDTDGSKIATFTFKAGVGSLVSLTNIKVTGNAEFIIDTPQEDLDINDSEGNGIDGEDIIINGDGSESGDVTVDDTETNS